MRRLLTSLLLGLSLTAGAQQNITVMTYNIHHGNPPSKPGQIDLEAIAAVIHSESPDLVGLQEVDVFTKRSGSDLNEAAWLAEKTGMYYYFARAIDFDGGQYGTAILSKYPISKGKTITLPTIAGSGGEPRSFAVAEISLPGKKSLVFANTHLDAGDDDDNRLQQMAFLLNRLEKENGPLLLTGDMNAEDDGAVIRQLDAIFQRTCVDDCPASFPQDKPEKTIDYIAFRKKKNFTVQSHRTVKETYASDHLPVIATLALP